MSFSQGHALIIGVGQYQHIPYANVPVAVQDAQAIDRVIKDAQYCGYPDNQVELLSDTAATRIGTLTAIDRLAQRAGESDTIFLFYCGHGALGQDGYFYLVSHDAQVEKGRVVPGSGVNEVDLIEKLQTLKSRRILFVFNTCHSGEISPTLSLDQQAFDNISPSEDVASALLSTGSGRIIITACRETQKSYIGTGQLSVFTQALVDGLHGKGVGNHAGFIGAYDLYEYIFESVTTKKGELQEPELTVLKGIGPFAVALYKGASALGEFNEDQPIPDTPAVRQVKPETAQRSFNQIIQVRDGAIAIGKESQAVGKGGILVKGNVKGDVIGTGGKKDGPET